MRCGGGWNRAYGVDNEALPEETGSTDRPHLRVPRQPPTLPPSPGAGYYLLVRAVNECRLGTYDTDGWGQAGTRDGVVPDVCP